MFSLAPRGLEGYDFYLFFQYAGRMRSDETSESFRLYLHLSIQLYLHLKYSQCSQMKKAGNSRAAGPQESDLRVFSLKQS